MRTDREIGFGIVDADLLDKMPVYRVLGETQENFRTSGPTVLETMAGWASMGPAESRSLPSL